MIVVRLSGGLGNQLFQYAVGRRLAIRHKTDLILEDSFYIKTPYGVTPRSYELVHYPIKARRVTASERFQLGVYSNRYTRIIRNYINIPGRYLYIREFSHQFNDFLLNAPNNIFLDGYWQSEKYFLGAESELINELQPIEDMSSDDALVAKEMKDTNSVGLHIRRGDYVTLESAKNHHGVCDLNYYQNAVNLISKNISNPVFFIFSDDLNWAKDNLNLKFPCFFIGHNSAQTGFQDLRLLSLANHQIIANSSFSWWAAWLNSNKNKIIIRPKKWLLRSPEVDEWICPRNWISI